MTYVCLYEQRDWVLSQDSTSKTGLEEAATWTPFFVGTALFCPPLISYEAGHTMMLSTLLGAQSHQAWGDHPSQEGAGPWQGGERG